MGADAALSHSSKPQPSLSSSQPPNANPTNSFYTSSLCKAALVTLSLVLLPLLPSIAPDFINQTLHARSWELLQLIFVGIAVSYGLFSKKNDDKDSGGSKLDNAQSYVTKLLQVSSVFDDESESRTVIQEENKVETFNSQYYRGEPVVVVAKQGGPAVGKQDRNGEIGQNRPLLLPVRSLKQRVPELDSGDESSGGKNSSVSDQSRLSSSSMKPKNVEVGGLSFGKTDESLEENVVLRSPIPWRSRSGRMEMKKNGDEEAEVNRIDHSIFAGSPKPNSSLSAPPKKLSPSKNHFSFSPPPAPPPPPTPQFLRKSVLSKSNSSFTNKNAVSPEKVLRRSVTNAQAEELDQSEMEELTRRSESNFMRDKIQVDGLAKSVRTYRSSELVTGVEEEAMDYETKFVEEKGYAGTMTNNGKFTKVEKVMMETSSDEESETESTTEEDDYFNSNNNNKVSETDNSVSVNDLGPDVDKKADEFIAKFREQIRLQRIESIRRSTAQRAGKTMR